MYERKEHFGQRPVDPVEIDDLLRQDEAELKEKRKRLRAFATALEDMRSAQAKAQEAADAVINNGDATPAELTPRLQTLPR